MNGARERATGDSAKMRFSKSRTGPRLGAEVAVCDRVGGVLEGTEGAQLL